MKYDCCVIYLVKILMFYFVKFVVDVRVNNGWVKISDRDYVKVVE